MRRVLFLGVIALGLGGAGCAGDRQSTDTSAQQSVAPDVTNPNQLPGRAQARGLFDNQVPSQQPFGMPGQGIPQTSFQRYDQQMYRGSFGP
jgi:hypothetical protein